MALPILFLGNNAYAFDIKTITADNDNLFISSQAGLNLEYTETFWDAGSFNGAPRGYGCISLFKGDFPDTSVLSNGSCGQQGHLSGVKLGQQMIGIGGRYSTDLWFASTTGVCDNTLCGTGSGNYFIVISAGSAGGSGGYDVFASSTLFVFNSINLSSGGVWSVLPYSFTPQIYNLSYATTTGYANITGYWEATTTPYISQKLSFWQFSNTLGRESYVQLTATTTGVFNFSFPFKDPFAWSTGTTTTAPIYESFTLNASLDQYDETNYVFPYGGTIIVNLDTASTTISAITQYNASDFTSSPRALALYPEYECSITSLTGCFKNAIIWAFYPTQETLDNWTSLLTLIQSKAPVGYFYMAKDSIGGLSATSTKAFNVAIPSSLKTYVFNPFDTAIAAILWFFFVFNFYKRLKTITI